MANRNYIILEDKDGKEVLPVTDGNGVFVEGGTKKLESKLTEIDSKTTELNEQLEHKASYPILIGEIGVVNIKQPYGNILRYGCVGDSTTDNTIFFQNAIDSATAIGCEVYCPIGVYRINGTILLPTNITIKGVSSNKNIYDYNSSPSTFKGSIFLTYGKYVFYPKTKDSRNTQKTRVTFRDVLFYNKASSDIKAMLFKLFIFHSSTFFNVSTMDYNVVFYSGIAGNTNISNCHFGGIVRAFVYCLSTDSEETDENLINYNTGLVDSFINNNYINGKALSTGCIMFQSKSLSHSTITNNFIDYAKIVFSLSTSSKAMVINANVFDVCYRVFKGCVSGFNISNNSFNNIKYIPSYWGSLTDSEMITNEWCVIEPSSGFTNNTITSNIANVSQQFIKADTIYGIYNNTIDKNSIYSYEGETPFLYSVIKGKDPNEQKNIYIGDLMYKEYSALPNPSLSITGGVYRITSFNGHIIRYKNKLIYNNNGVWTNMDGSTFIDE